MSKSHRGTLYPKSTLFIRNFGSHAENSPISKIKFKHHIAPVLEIVELDFVIQLFEYHNFVLITRSYDLRPKISTVLNEKRITTQLQERNIFKKIRKTLAKSFLNFFLYDSCREITLNLMVRLYIHI